MWHCRKDDDERRPPRANTSRVYGRGFYDGQRKAMESMNNARLISIEQNLTGVARKVLEATPCGEPATLPSICGELTRQGHHLDIKVVHGCLLSMLSQGVVREPTSGCFVRLNPKPKLVAKKAAPVAEPAPPAPEPAASAAPPEPAPAAPGDVPAEDAPGIKRLIDIVTDVRAMANSAMKLATDIEDAALDMEARLERLQADTVKLRQLQALLKSIGD